METISSYIYDNSVVVQIATDPSITTRNRVVYTRPVKIYKGVDNLIKVQVQNQDQRPIDVTDYTLTFSVVDSVSTIDSLNSTRSVAGTIFQTNVVISNASLGIGTVTISAADMDEFVKSNYTFSIKYATGDLTLPAYTDDNWGASGQLIIISDSFIN